MLETFPQLKYYGDQVKRRLKEEKLHEQVSQLQEQEALAAIKAVQQQEGSRNIADKMSQSDVFKRSVSSQPKFVLPMA